MELTEELAYRLGIAPLLGLMLIKDFGMVTLGVESDGFVLELIVVLGVETVDLTEVVAVVLGVETVGQILVVTVVLGVERVGFVKIELLDTLDVLLAYGDT